MFKTKLLNVFHRFFAPAANTKRNRTLPPRAVVQASPQTAVKAVAGTWNDFQPKQVDDFESLEHLLKAPGERLVKPPLAQDAWSRWDMR